MNRRAFLAALAGTAGGLVLPEPDARRVYSFPSVPSIVVVPAKYWGRIDELVRRCRPILDEMRRQT
jgi:hypothetical protein